MYTWVGQKRCNYARLRTGPYAPTLWGRVSLGAGDRRFWIRGGATMHTEGRIQSGATMHALDPGLSYSDKVPQYRLRFIMIFERIRAGL